MARTVPIAISSRWPRTKREARIFLDYLRNDRTSTAVAPLSPRARARRHGFDAADLEQVRSDLDPQGFTVRTVPAGWPSQKPGRSMARASARWPTR